MKKSTSIWKKLYQYKAHHILLWIGYFLFWMIPYQNMYPFPMLLWITFQYFIFNAIAFYLTAYYLIPHFLLRRKYFQFSGLSIASVILLSIGLAYCLYFSFKNIPEAIEIGGVAYFWIAFISIVMMTGLLSGAKLLVDKIRSDRQAKEFEQQRLESELQYLKAQVNPHFLFNAINSIYILIRKDPDKAAETLIKLSDLLRFQLYETSDNLITIEKELEYIQNYVELEKLRRGEKIKFNLTVNGNMQGFKIAPFLLMPLLENTFKHVSHHEDNQIEIILTRENSTLTASFFNTKDEEPGIQVGGIGLTNLNRRLTLLYPDAHAIVATEGRETYNVTLTVPIS